VEYTGRAWARMVKYTSLGRWRSWVQIPATPPMQSQLLSTNHKSITINNLIVV